MRLWLASVLVASICAAGCARETFSLEEYERRVRVGSEFRTERNQIIYMRDRWPAGEPLRIGVAFPRNFHHPTAERSLRITPRFEGGREVRKMCRPTNTLLYVLPTPWGDGLDAIGTPPRDASEIEFAVLAEEEVAGAVVTIRGATIRRPIEIVDSAEQVVRPVDDERVTAIIAERLRLGVAIGDGRHIELCAILPRVPSRSRNGETFDIEREPEMVREFEGLSIALRVSFWDGAEEVAVSEFFLSGSMLYSSARLVGDTDRLRSAVLGSEPWRVVVEGDPVVALGDLARDRYWSGRIERPLAEVEVREIGDQSPWMGSSWLRPASPEPMAAASCR